jgi:hypothetical protein
MKKIFEEKSRVLYKLPILKFKIEFNQRETLNSTNWDGDVISKRSRG